MQVHDQAAFKQRVESILDEFLDEEIDRLTEMSESLAPIAVQVRDAVASGKRLRSAFCYWGWRAAGQSDCEAVVKAAAAMELVHAAAKVHDDVIDASPTRHGVPTAHVALDRLVECGDSPGLGGTALALLLGDMLAAWSVQLFASCGLPGAFIERARPLWASLTRELIAGEILDVMLSHRPVPVDIARQIARLKSSRYSVELPLHLGARLGGASQSTVQTLAAYGRPVGEAFQLRDDLLGVFGDPHLTGKSNLDDLTGGKPTVLLAITRSLASPPQRACIDRLMGRTSLTRADADEVRQVMQVTGAREQAEQLVRERHEQALAALDRSRFDHRSYHALRALATIACQRTN
jgi:geranylgeranyl diphosphate synthase type I